VCGITGAVGSLAPRLIAAVAQASAAQRHRGPDDDGHWQSGPDGGFGAMFAFRRLAILDLTPGGHQPMVDAATGNGIVFNGEIYNFRELRAELTAAGVSFTSQSDTEVLLRAFAVHGERVLERLRGMFALAIWDAQSQTVLLARDRLGIKPLYVAATERSGAPALLFASELRSLLATNAVDRRLDRRALDSYLWNGFVVGAQSIVAGIELLPAGTFARIDPRRPRCAPVRYWSLPSAPATAAGPEPVAELAHELRTAMAQHLVSDVPLGVFLSGGIDSSAIAALAAKSVPGGPRALRTFNISFDEAAYDESPHARAVATAIGSDHTDIRLSEQAFVDGIDAALAAIDQPTFDGINSWFVSRAVRAAGVTVALAGTGGDEIFGGYVSFDEVPRMARAARLVRWLPRRPLRAVSNGFARLRMRSFGDVPPQTRWGKVGDVLAGGGGLLHAYQTHCALFTADMHAALQGTSTAGDGIGMTAEHAAWLADRIAGQPARHAVSLLELAQFVGERLLRDADWSSMAVSLELRVPLLDHRVVEAASRVDEVRRFLPPRKKALLRQLALGGIDPRLFDRKKSGFVLPLDVWCRRRLRDRVGSLLLDAAACRAAGLDGAVVARLWRAFLANAPGLYWSRIWSLFVLLHWCQRQRVAA
jgi:asparagine synthase (glutamine-hydrolysing)